MHAYLFIGDSVQTNILTITSLLDINHIASYDRMMLIPGDKASIGIKEARQFISALSLSPQSSPFVAGIIPDASLLTPEAQQALLKTIEEPPPSVQLYISATSETLLLDTIVSRCQITRVLGTSDTITQQDHDACKKTLDALALATRGERIAIIQSIAKTKEDAKRFIDTAIMCYERELHATSVSDDRQRVVAHTIHELLTAKQLAGNNVHPVQLLEHIYLATVI